MTRTWETGDAIAERDGDTWQLGSVVGVDGLVLAIRFEGGDRASFRNRYSPQLADPDQVPIDERHWLPERLRDQLVRQEAAGRLRALADALRSDAVSRVVRALAEDFDDFHPDHQHMAAAARALLTPAPQPATTP